MRTQTRRYLYIAFSIFCTCTASFAQNTAVKKDTVANHKPPARVKEILSKTTPEDQEYAARKYQFIEDALEDWVDTTSSASLVFEIGSDQALPFFLDSEGLKGLKPFYPGSPDDIPQARNPDIPPTISLNEAIQSLLKNYGQSRRKAKEGNWPVPTDLEIDVLKVLWVEQQATSSEIYAKLDTSTMIFSEELHQILDGMVERGFVDRKKLSPSHEFSLFGIAQIELSSKNRKNKVYLYWPIVTKETLYTYLDAKRYLALIAARGEGDYDLKANNYEKNYQKYLEKKLYRMFE